MHRAAQRRQVRRIAVEIDVKIIADLFRFAVRKTGYDLFTACPRAAGEGDEQGLGRALQSVCGFDWCVHLTAPVQMERCGAKSPLRAARV